MESRVTRARFEMSFIHILHVYMGTTIKETTQSIHLDCIFIYLSKNHVHVAKVCAQYFCRCQ